MYVTAQDIKTRLGAEDYAVLVGETKGTARIRGAIADACGEIDGHVQKRYALPLPAPVPTAIKRIAVDIVIYRLSGDSRVTEDRRQRYEDAVSFLRAIARGDVSLGIAPAAADKTQAKETVVITSSKRRFNRKNQTF